jgi:hypothetical protein
MSVIPKVYSISLVPFERIMQFGTSQENACIIVRHRYDPEEPSEIPYIPVTTFCLAQYHVVANDVESNNYDHLKKSGVDAFSDRDAEGIIRFLSKTKHVDEYIIYYEYDVAVARGIAAAISYIFNGSAERFLQEEIDPPNYWIYTSLIRKAIEMELL